MEKAKTAIAAPTSRRNFVKSSVALALAGLAPVAMSKASAAVPSVSSGFAAKCQRYRELKTALDSLYEKNDIRLKRLERPELPGALLGPLEIPGFGMRPPDETKHGTSLQGWSASELERLATQGKWEVFVKEDKKDGSVTVKSGFRAVSRATKKRATELLTVRVAYDAEIKKWFAKVHKIENSTRGPMKKMDNALLEAMEHRVTHIGELFQKVQLAQEADLFADHSYPGDRETKTLECLFRDIEKLALQA